jgi:hypothetical protein
MVTAAVQTHQVAMAAARHPAAVMEQTELPVGLVDTTTTAMVLKVDKELPSNLLRIHNSLRRNHRSNNRLNLSSHNNRRQLSRNNLNNQRRIRHKSHRRIPLRSQLRKLSRLQATSSSPRANYGCNSIFAMVCSCMLLVPS